MGTLSITLRAIHMKKEAEFVVYPISSHSDTKKICLQSNSYWAEIYLDKKQIEFSARRENANSWSFAWDQAHKKTKTYPLENSLISEIVEKVAETAGSKVGFNLLGVYSDNSKANQLKS